MSMQHQQALATKASERYLLGEMDEPERFEFEAHYFDCPACAEDVRTGVAMARGIKAVCAEDATLRPHISVVREVPRRGWFSWLSPASLVPSTAALAFGSLAAWQAFVLIPSLRWANAPQALSPVVLRAAARGEPAGVVGGEHVQAGRDENECEKREESACDQELGPLRAERQPGHRGTASGAGRRTAWPAAP